MSVTKIKSSAQCSGRECTELTVANFGARLLSLFHECAFPRPGETLSVWDTYIGTTPVTTDFATLFSLVEMFPRPRSQKARHIYH